MTELSKEILATYQIRKTACQKRTFMEFLQKQIPETVIESGGFPKNNNLVIGNVDNAKIILGAHYDTCARMPIPNFITPLNPLLSVAYSVLIMIPIFLIVFVLNLFLNIFTESFMIHYFFSLVGMFICFALMLVGPANKHTVNDNTSGVITLCEIYAQLSAEEKEKVVLVFFDNEEKGLLGSAAFRKKHKKQLKEKLLINFDCVSDGNNLLFAVNKAAGSKYGNIIDTVITPTDKKSILIKNAEKVYYPSDQAGFPNAIAVAALKQKKVIGYYMDRIHTVKDTVMDEGNIEYLRDHIIELVKRI